MRERLGLDAEAFGALWQEALALLQAPALQAYFDPARYRRAWNELPYRDAAGQVRRIDRLVEFDEEIWILDYKTGEPGGSRAAAAYRAQLADYRRAMATVFPDKPVRSVLVFRGGVLYPLED